MTKNTENPKDETLQDQAGAAPDETPAPGEAADETVESLKDKNLRLSAEFENARKRLEKRSQDMVKFANEQLLLDILPVVDDMDRAISSLDQGHDQETVKQGLHLVQNTFHKILDQAGVKPIASVGQPFNPDRHEAVGEVETADVKEGFVAEEIQRGYELNGRLARPALVKIAKPQASETGGSEHGSEQSNRN